jgi:hypothetical protein
MEMYSLFGVCVVNKCECGNMATPKVIKTQEIECLGICFEFFRTLWNKNV